ncbi:diguanylate cyclase/phosphodiesterase (GGDEF & EAL domains) with PAS/PAC sensor(s) [Salisediminibacterium beveridgei]|uniref:Diguanylate cyclase/phosphodiesterase (GGDEF & EAL domains) with PAS/PAC sensor(S) n=2 Tax=Salisediminibacterium beveridgei TaxID=632773 RepID=A0A1D7QXU6_9BACI|nr:diguanylate cyclase/phosphodiesterase (GGDEF & EAL domains) with PAS/PAC sensor(s) [Salisediminibacterium beveridgei]
MKGTSMKSMNVKGFIAGFFLVTIFFSVMAYSTVVNRIDEVNAEMKEHAIQLAESYSDTFTKAASAREFINELLEERLEAAGQSVMMNHENLSNEQLVDLVNQFNVDVIYLYNRAGEVTHSSSGDYIGWTATDEHPAGQFLHSVQDSLVEEIRSDTKSGVPYKFGYYRLDDGAFSQIGIEANVAAGFFDGFKVANMLEEMRLLDGVIDVAFISEGKRITFPDQSGFGFGQLQDAEEEPIHDMDSDGYEIYEHKGGYRIFVPVTGEDETVIGTLSIMKSSDRAVEVRQEILRNNVVIYASVLLFAGFLIAGWYRKSKKHLQLAYFEPLTRLPNYGYMQKFMKAKLANGEVQNMAVFMINCRHFGAINLSHGYEYGDELLQMIAKSLRENIRNSDMLFHFSADRFFLYVDDPGNSQLLEMYAEFLLNQIDELIQDDGQISAIHSNIGIVESRKEMLTLDQLTKRGAITLNQLDIENTHRILFFNDEMEIQIQREERIVQEIKSVIHQGNPARFHLMFQPQLELISGKVSGYEALARMTSATYGPLSPLEFIAIAEKKHLIVDLGYTIIDQACQFVYKLEKEGLNKLRVAVNVSAIQLLRKDFSERFLDLCKINGVDPSSFEVEVTESILLDKDDEMRRHLNQLRNKGVTVSLDDFGTGYSSFARLQNLPVDRVKIDRTFTNRIGDHSEEDPILSDLISMCHKLGKSVVTEGVEEEYQMRYLLDQECDYVQGYCVSRPLEIKAALDFAKQQHLLQ